MTIKSTAYWDVTPCCPVVVHLCFAATYCPHYHGPRHISLRLFLRPLAPFSAPPYSADSPICLQTRLYHPLLIWAPFSPLSILHKRPIFRVHAPLRNWFFLLVTSGFLPNPVRNHVLHTRPIKLASFFLLVACLTCLRPWGRRHNVPPKSRWISIEFRTQKRVTAVRTRNPAVM